ncbi:MAG: type II toxin-antitoxin system VapC family toxin [Chloroflexi bacterium]|nr:MAG: type II toxin-antitoxin system VapC family toxin [Chloroflexota bacterium]
MTAVIVDTDVVSFLLKADTRANLYREHLVGKTLAISFMTVAELYQWAYGRSWGDKRIRRLEEQLRAYLVIPYDNELCRHWARICVERQRAGRPISVQDAWIAATAVRHGCPLVTHNRTDFTDIMGLEVISEA